MHPLVQTLSDFGQFLGLNQESAYNSANTYLNRIKIDKAKTEENKTALENLTSLALQKLAEQHNITVEHIQMQKRIAVYRTCREYFCAYMMNHMLPADAIKKPIMNLVPCSEAINRDRTTVYNCIEQFVNHYTTEDNYRIGYDTFVRNIEQELINHEWAKDLCI
jgi:hypothetical protein